jgi:hypothetical protein
MKYLTLMISRNISRTNKIDIEPPLGFEPAARAIRRFFSACLRPYAMHFVGKFDLGRDLLQGKDLHEKIRQEEPLSPLHFAARPSILH